MDYANRSIPVRLLLSAVMASLTLLPAFPQIAHADTVSDARIRALKASLAALQRRYQEQERRIERLERLEQRLEAMTSSGPRTVPKARVAGPVATPTPSATATPASRVAIVPPSTGSSPKPQQLGGAAPKTESTKDIYQQQNALFAHGLTLTPGVQYSYGDNRLFTLNGFLALGAIFLGNIDVTRQQNNIVEPSLTADYSASPRTEYEVTVPWVYRDSIYDAQGVQNSSQLTSMRGISAAQFGDINAAVYYQLPQRRANGHEVVLNARLSIPTGSAPYGIKIFQDTTNANLSYPNKLPTGSGVYTASVGATVIQTADPAILFGGINIFANLVRHFDDISTSPVTVQPGRVAAGDAISATLGTAFALNDKVSTSFSFQDTLVEPTRVIPDGTSAWQTVVGSNLNAAVFNIGTTISTSPKTYWQAVLGIGMTQDAPNYQLNLRFPHGP